MAREILLCERCRRFTMNKDCICGGNVINPKPAKWSPEDKWGEYRRAYKQRISA